MAIQCPVCREMSHLTVKNVQAAVTAEENLVLEFFKTHFTKNIVPVSSVFEDLHGMLGQEADEDELYNVQ